MKMSPGQSGLLGRKLKRWAHLDPGTTTVIPCIGSLTSVSSPSTIVDLRLGVDRSQFERKTKEADNQQGWLGRLQEERKES